MRPGFLIVFFVTFAICSAIAQMLSPLLDRVRANNELLYWIYAILAGAVVLIIPFLATRAWNRGSPK